MINLNNLKIGTLLSLGITAMLLFIIVMGIVSCHQACLIRPQTEIMYSHPIKVRKAIGNLEADILSMRLGLHDKLIFKTINAVLYGK